MANKNTPNVSAACATLLTELGRTRNLRALGYLVRTAIARRDVLLGYEVEALDLNLDKVEDSKSRSRLTDMLERVASLKERKDVSTFCSAAINQRKACRARAAA